MFLFVSAHVVEGLILYVRGQGVLLGDFAEL